MTSATLLSGQLSHNSIHTAQHATCTRFSRSNVHLARGHFQNSAIRPVVPAIRLHGTTGTLQGSRKTCQAAAAEAAGAPTSDRSSSNLDDSRAFAVALAKIADDTKAEDLTVLHVEPLVSWCSYMVLCTVMSKPQLLAVLGRMEDAAQDDWCRPKQNSAGSSQWEVLDFGDVVVHVFTAEQREHYDLDSFYAQAEEVALPFLADWKAANSSSSGSSAEQDPRSSSMRQLGPPVWSKNL